MRNVEVQAVTPSGVWLLAAGKEYWLDHKLFPWFRNAVLVDVFDVILEHGHCVRWPKLDVDLELECLDDPERFPLVSRP